MAGKGGSAVRPPPSGAARNGRRPSLRSGELDLLDRAGVLQVPPDLALGQAASAGKLVRENRQGDSRTAKTPKDESPRVRIRSKILFGLNCPKSLARSTALCTACSKWNQL